MGVVRDDDFKDVENGTELVNQSGETLNEIVDSVKKVTDIVAEIAAASNEQLTGIEQVNRAVSEMDRITQSNATQTEEMSGTSSSLLSHAEELGQLVARFRLDDNVAQPTSQYDSNRNRQADSHRNSRPESRTNSNGTYQQGSTEPAFAGAGAGDFEEF